MALTYKAYDVDNGRTILTIANVLDNVTLSGGSVTTASAELTVASTTGIYPSMAISCYGFTLGAYVLAVKNSTTLIISEASTATASSLTVIASGFNSKPVGQEHNMGTYRDLFTNTVVYGWPSASSAFAANAAASIGGQVTGASINLSSSFGSSGNINAASYGGGGNAILLKGTPTFTNTELSDSVTDNLKVTTVAASTTEFTHSDEFAHLAPRFLIEKWGKYIFVSTGGVVSQVPASVNIAIALA